jgi:threonine synthase
MPVVFSIPSGNFGNLTAGLMAQKMGLPIEHFIAATNANDVVPKYLNTGDYQPRPSQRTLSNAMDVGAPSNFARMLDIYCSTWNNMRQDISGYGFSDTETKQAMQEINSKYDYVIDPHGAVGYLALRKYQETHPDHLGVILETAHPSKFIEDVESILEKQIDIPERLAALSNAKKVSVKMNTEYSNFKPWLMERF